MGRWPERLITATMPFRSRVAASAFRNNSLPCLSLHKLCTTVQLPARLMFSVPNAYANANKYAETNQFNEIVVGAVGANGTFSESHHYGANLTVVCLPVPLAVWDHHYGSGRQPGYNGGPGPRLYIYFRRDVRRHTAGGRRSCAAKEAQPNLDTRFAKHLLALTSTMVDPADATRFGDTDIQTLLPILQSRLPSAAGVQMPRVSTSTTCTALA